MVVEIQLHKIPKNWVDLKWTLHLEKNMVSPLEYIKVPSTL